MGKRGKPPTTPIRIARNKLKLTQAQVAESVPVALRHYQQIENWVVMPRVLLAMRLAKRLSSTVDELWGDLLFDP